MYCQVPADIRQVFVAGKQNSCIAGNGRGTLIVSGRNFSLTFTGIEGAMSFEYKKALEEDRIYLEYLRNMMWTSVYFEKLDASFKAQIMDASGSLIKFPDPLKEDDGFFYHDPNSPLYWMERWEWEGKKYRMPDGKGDFWDCSYTCMMAYIKAGLIDYEKGLRWSTEGLFGRLIAHDALGDWISKDPSQWKDGAIIGWRYIDENGEIKGHMAIWTKNYRGHAGFWHNRGGYGVEFDRYKKTLWDTYIKTLGMPWGYR